MSSSSAKYSQNTSVAPSDPSSDLIRQMRLHEVAIAELSCLPSTRSVYVKNGNIFFRTSIQKATASEQKLVDSAKSNLQKQNSS